MPQVVGLGVDAYLKMLLVDNFVHTDLHPGNIFVCKQESKVTSWDVSVRPRLQPCPVQRAPVSGCNCATPALEM